jgi:hypothetical protein
MPGSLPPPKSSSVPDTSTPHAPCLRLRLQDAELATLPQELVRPEALDEARIEDLIAQHLTHNLEILPENVSVLGVKNQSA